MINSPDQFLLHKKQMTVTQKKQMTGRTNPNYIIGNNIIEFVLKSRTKDQNGWSEEGWIEAFKILTENKGYIPIVTPSTPHLYSPTWHKLKGHPIKNSQSDTTD